MRSEVEDEVRLQRSVGDGPLPPAVRRVLPRHGLARVERRLKVGDEVAQLQTCNGKKCKNERPWLANFKRQFLTFSHHRG